MFQTYTGWLILMAFIYIFPNYLRMVRFSKASKDLEDTTKLMLFELNYSVRKTYNFLAIVSLVFYYIIYWFKIADVFIPMVFTPFILKCIVDIIQQNKIKKSKLDIKYYSKLSILLNILLVLGLSIVIIYYYSNTTPLSKSSEDYQFEAQEKMHVKDYKNAIDLYTESIQIDSLNSNSFFNRAMCKYYLKDTPGACADWRRAEKLGEEIATRNIERFCK